MSVKQTYEAAIRYAMSRDLGTKLDSKPDLGKKPMLIDTKVTKIPAGGPDPHSPAGRIVTKDYFANGHLYEDFASGTRKGPLSHTWYDCGIAPATTKAALPKT